MTGRVVLLGVGRVGELGNEGLRARQRCCRRCFSPGEVVVSTRLEKVGKRS